MCMYRYNIDKICEIAPGARRIHGHKSKCVKRRGRGANNNGYVRKGMVTQYQSIRGNIQQILIVNHKRERTELKAQIIKNQDATRNQMLDGNSVVSKTNTCRRKKKLRSCSVRTEQCQITKHHYRMLTASTLEELGETLAGSNESEYINYIRRNIAVQRQAEEKIHIINKNH